MNRFKCSDAYKKDLGIYYSQVLEKNGTSSPMARREALRLAEMGNTAAANFCADLIFYGDIARKNRYAEAFDLYMKSACITVDEGGNWQCGEEACPLAFRNIGYYLVNYHRESVLEKCERIEAIEKLELKDRLALAFELSEACFSMTGNASALNLMGRIIRETEGDEAKAGEYFEKAARDGYVYACNNLAASLAERIVSEGKNSDDPEVDSYIEYLRIAADRYEPYAANRLGLFYVNGEIKASSGSVTFRDRIELPRAKEYFKKATLYHDANSAWAYFNLIKYFHRDYDTNLELLNEHMDYIKELNPAVYDLAMEL
ncbi:MAG: sel1 repeat family protein [Lachnospiraceae bacterium]|nr:sel1 repeat family protein [Lachnospiraceae bacterium]